MATVAFGMAPAAEAGTTGTADTRYSLVHGCFVLKPTSGGNFLAQTGNGYSATANAAGDAEPFRMQATDLGKYLFYGQAQDFLGLDSGPLADDSVIAATEPSNRANWTVEWLRGQVHDRRPGLAPRACDER